VKKATHQDRVKLAEEICNEVKGVLRDDLRAFVIYASVAKNEDVAYSDVEMMAVTSNHYEEHCAEFIRDGIRCEVEFIPFNSALQQAGKVSTRWPMAADPWHYFKPLYVKEDDGCLDQIQSAARAVLTDDEKFSNAIVEMMLILCETVAKLRNSSEIRKVKSDITVNCFYLAKGTMDLVGLVNRVFFSGMRNAFVESKKLPNLPTAYKKLIEIVLGEVEADLKTRYNSAMELWNNIKRWIDEQDIEWETQDLLMPKKKECK